MSHCPYDTEVSDTTQVSERITTLLNFFEYYLLSADLSNKSEVIPPIASVGPLRRRLFFSPARCFGVDSSKQTYNED